MSHKTLLKNEERQRCEVWTRVMGYHRPVSEFNPGKRGEHAERVHFREDRAHLTL
ncbi:MAG: anaerobic ribonucleoside-triphosphate reductase [Acidiferrobacter sp.]